MKRTAREPAGLLLILAVALAGCVSSAPNPAEPRGDDGGGEVDGRGATLVPGDGSTNVALAEAGPAAPADALTLAERDGSLADGNLRNGDDGLAVELDAEAGSRGDGPADARVADGADARSDASSVRDVPLESSPADAPPAAEVHSTPDGPRSPDVAVAPDAPPDLPPPDSLAASQVTIAIVGDTAEKGRTAQTRAVASMIRDHSPAVTSLFIAGDCVRYDGTGSLLSFFQKYWEPASEANLGQFNDIVFPQLGNHDYWEDRAQGYFDYFTTRLAAIAALPTYHGDANTVDRGWYSVDLNGWHIVDLNANCDEIPGGCDTGGAQEHWLSADLAAHAGMPTLALWHQPRWTCTSDGHASESAVQPLWARLYDAHADFVFNGHNHFYQRYQPLDKASSAKADQAAGLTEFIVGTGGSSTYHVCSASADSRVAKALDGDDSLGAMFLTLGADGSYRWEFRLTSDGSVFDSGAGRSHNAR